MRYRIRTLIIATALVGAGLGVFAIGEFLWLSHCKRLEPSLFAFVLEEELVNVQRAIKARESSALGGGPLPRDTPNRIFFAAGRSSDGKEWVAPTRSLLDSIGIHAVRSVHEREGNDPVYLLTNVRWIDWSTVSLDVEQIQANVHIATRRKKLRIEDGKWQLIQNGEYWAEEPTEDTPFSHSNSGLAL